MEAKELADKIFGIINVMENNDAVALFAKKDWGFEKWLQVELSWILNNYGKVVLEKTI